MITTRICRASLTLASLVLVTLILGASAVDAAPPRRDAQRLQNETEREARDRLRRVEYQRQVEKAQREGKEREQREAQERARREAQNRAREQAAAENAKLLTAPKTTAPGPKR